MADLKTPYAQRLCLSGVESRRLLDTFKDFGVHHIQVSFYYLRRVFADPLEFEDYARPFRTVIIDSGTVYGNVKSAHEKEELLSDYESYLGALDKRVYTAAVAEPDLDLDGILPDEMLIHPLDDIRPVFDNDMGAIFRNVKYVGVSQKEASEKGGENLVPIFAQASKRGAYIHAFGTGSRKLLTKYPFYSANTSSWRSGSRYLNTYIYEGPGRGLKLFQPSDKKDPVKTEKEMRNIRRRQKNLIGIRQPDIAPLINTEDFMEGDSWEVDKANLSQWVLFQQDLELLPHNKYFLTDHERTDILLRKQDLLANPNTGANTTNNINRDIAQADIEDVNSREEIEEIKGADIEGGHDIEPDDIRGGDIEADIVDAEVIPDTDIPNTPQSSGTPYTPAIISPGGLGAPSDRTPRITPVDDRMRQTRQCDFCVLAGRCPKYQPSAPCSYGLPPENPTYDHNDMDQVIKEQFADIMATQMDRIQQLALEERMDASGANKDLTNNIKLWAEIISLYKEAIAEGDSVSIKAKGPNVIDMFKPKG